MRSRFRVGDSIVHEYKISRDASAGSIRKFGTALYEDFCMNHCLDERIVKGLLSMGYRPLRSRTDYFLKPIGHGCLVFRDGRIDMVFEGIILDIIIWSSTSIEIESESSIIRQIMNAESQALDGAKFDRHGETFSFLSSVESVEALL